MSFLPNEHNRILIRTVFIGVLFSFTLNFVWERAQAHLYAGEVSFWWCFRAAWGDVLLVGLIGFLVGVFFHDRHWVRRFSLQHLGVMLVAGAIVATGVEYWGLSGRWSYAPAMLIVPGLGIGLSPLLQMILLPPIVYGVIGVLIRRKVLVHV